MESTQPLGPVARTVPLLIKWAAIIVAVSIAALVVTVMLIAFNAKQADIATRQADAAIRQADAVKDQRIGELIAYIQNQNSGIAAERTSLLMDQGLLLKYTYQLATREAALLQYLRSHGIKLPTNLVTEIAPPRLIYVPATKGSSKTPKAGPGGTGKKKG